MMSLWTLIKRGKENLVACHEIMVIMKNNTKTEHTWDKRKKGEREGKLRVNFNSEKEGEKRKRARE